VYAKWTIILDYFDNISYDWNLKFLEDSDIVANPSFLYATEMVFLEIKITYSEVQSAVHTAQFIRHTGGPTSSVYYQQHGDRVVNRRHVLVMPGEGHLDSRPAEPSSNRNSQKE
jgi:hypothetical protein